MSSPHRVPSSAGCDVQVYRSLWQCRSRHTSSRSWAEECRLPRPYFSIPREVLDLIRGHHQVRVNSFIHGASKVFCLFIWTIQYRKYRNGRRVSNNIFSLLCRAQYSTSFVQIYLYYDNITFLIAYTFILNL